MSIVRPFVPLYKNNRLSRYLAGEISKIKVLSDYLSVRLHVRSRS